MKMQIAIVMGGPSAEYEISLLSGREVLCNIDKSRYIVRAIVITKDKRYYIQDIQADLVPSLESIESLGKLAAPFRSPDFNGPFSAADVHEIWSSYKTAFLALHGDFGEDGKIQGMLDMLGIAYNGSGVLASALAMHKIKSKYVFLQSGLATPVFSVFGGNNPETSIDIIVARHGFPCFVKCPQSGSSRLMGRAHDQASLEGLLEEYSAVTDEILIETAIKGIEFTCPVLERPDGSIQALPPIEIRPKTSDFFDYTAKYTSGASEEIVPAPRPADTIAEIQKRALVAHKALGCRGVSRTDMIQYNDEFFVLEVNTLPGLTANSLLPKSFQAIGGSYSELIDILIKTGQKRVGSMHS